MFFKPFSALVIVVLGQLNHFIDHNHKLLHTQNKNIPLFKKEDHEDHQHGKKLVGRFSEAKIVIIKNFFINSLFKTTDSQQFSISKYLINHIGHIFSNIRLVLYGCRLEIL